VLSAIGDALDGSKRPAFIVGAAVDRDGAWDEVVRLAERHHAAVWVGPMSGRCSFPEDHALFAGFLPPMRERIVQLLAGHDLVFALGAPAFTYHVEGFGPHVPEGAKLVQLIDDPSAAAWAPEGTSVVCSIRLGVLDLLARDPPPPRERPRPRMPPPRIEPSSPMTVPYVMQTLAEIRDPASIVVEEAPSSRSAAVGIALAKPAARVIALIGDGSAMYSIQALWSAAQLALPIAFVILKNRRYAALQDFAPAFGFRPDERLPGTDLPDIDFVALARGQGCRGSSVSQPEELRDALAGAFTASVPTLVEVEVA
jgi:benzoylformate decarboxylase